MSPRQASRQIAVAALAAAAMGTASAASQPHRDATATVAKPTGSRVTVYGCEAEDVCRINYHPNGTWTLRRVHP